jgi:DNA invertase Pin-like site-specific DNA recombinase
MRAKVGPAHLQRQAFVYVRQSTTTQVFEHKESTKRQYALADRAVALGWPREAVEIIDEDQGMSGASTEGRSGFARLVDAVAHGQAGAVLAVEVSRLARSSVDWQRLMSLCAVAQVPVIDEQTIYDPADKDDKLLLDLKGTMSEAELHWLGLRMNGARQSKARRGELRFLVPTGYEWREGRLALDPDEAVQRAIRVLFDRFTVEPSAWAVVRWARRTGYLMPTRRWFSDGSSQLEWKLLGRSRLYEILRNPIYAGVYVYGRRPSRKQLVNGEIRVVREPGRDPAKWPVRIDGSHPAYLSWEAFMRNQEKLRQNHTARGGASQGPPREGEGLLSGLLVCGRCGHRMITGYGSSRKRRWYYQCPGRSRDKGENICWSAAGPILDEAVEKLFLETMVPSELDLSLAVDREVDKQAQSLEQQWRSRLEQAAYEARRAERRYKAVDPENRVVARTLERE